MNLHEQNNDNLINIMEPFLLGDGKVYDRRKLLVEFNENSILFRMVLMEIFLNKIRKRYGKWIDKSTDINNVFFRAGRYNEVQKFKNETGINFPKMELSNVRLLILLIIYALPWLAFVTLISMYDFAVYPDIFILIFSCLVFMHLPVAIISIIVPNFFSPFDWREVKELDDLLIDLVTHNYKEYTENDYERTFEELEISV